MKSISNDEFCHKVNAACLVRTSQTSSNHHRFALHNEIVVRVIGHHILSHSAPALKGADP